MPSPRDLVLANLGLLLHGLVLGRLFSDPRTHPPELGCLLGYAGAPDLRRQRIDDRRHGGAPARAFAGHVPWRRVFILGGMGVTLGSLLTSFGVLLSSGLSSAIVSTTSPVGSALTAAWLFGEKLGGGIIVATFLSVVGGLVSVTGEQSIAGTQFRGGEILIVLANVLWTWMSIQAQRWLKGFSQLQIAAFTVLTGALAAALLPLVMITGGDRSPRELHARVHPAHSLRRHRADRHRQFLLALWRQPRRRRRRLAVQQSFARRRTRSHAILMGGSFAWQQILGTTIIVAGVLRAQLSQARRNARIR